MSTCLSWNEAKVARNSPGCSTMALQFPIIRRVMHSWHSLTKSLTRRDFTWLYDIFQYFSNLHGDLRLLVPGKASSRHILILETCGPSSSYLAHSMLSAVKLASRNLPGLPCTAEVFIGQRPGWRISHFIPSCKAEMEIMTNGSNGLQESTRLNERKLLKAEWQEGKGHHR